jgi:hypothetical protein
VSSWALPRQFLNVYGFRIQRNIGLRRASPPWGRASHLQRCSGSAATEQGLCKTVIATSKVNWATTLDCVIKEEEKKRVDCPLGRRDSSIPARSWIQGSGLESKEEEDEENER